MLAAAPSPKQAPRLSIAKIHGLLAKAGRQRGLDRRAREIHTGLQTVQLHAPDPIANAYAVSAAARVGMIVEPNRQIELIETELAPILSSTRRVRG